MPATSWQARVARRVPRRTSDTVTSRQVKCNDVVHPQFCIQQTDTMYKGCLASTLVAQWYKQPSSVQEIMGSNPRIIQIFTFCFILIYTELYQDILIYPRLAILKVSQYIHVPAEI